MFKLYPILELKDHQLATPCPEAFVLFLMFPRIWMRSRAQSVYQLKYPTLLQFSFQYQTSHCLILNNLCLLLKKSLQAPRLQQTSHQNPEHPRISSNFCFNYYLFFLVMTFEHLIFQLSMKLFLLIHFVVTLRKLATSINISIYGAQKFTKKN